MSRQLISSEKFPTKPHNWSSVLRRSNCHWRDQAGNKVLELSGSSLEQVVKYNVYLADMEDFAAMNEVYIDFLPQPMPSCSCLQAVPPGDGTVIEIECIAQT
ncbi:Yer057p UK114 family [Fusarium mundagurra]|uniref:Yer057p UK114 family n=1 Tax=Fusarium mundagurra TaxID=1567541 RepID=A0A8H5XR72_9HYPO|nr:Yer057p UK114 family [Fusarium mundagurra]